MKKGRLGFTLIEVALFLAITGALFIGVTVGVQNSINQQRYNDSVQSYIEFLRGVYAGVLNVQNDRDGGKSDTAIYGKLVTFGEEYDLAGNRLEASDSNKVFVYTVVGKVFQNAESGGALETLRNNLNMNVVVKREGANRLELAGFADSFDPKWGTRIETTTLNEQLKGSLLIVRHPSSGVVYTYFKNSTSDNQVNRKVLEANNAGARSVNILDWNGFEQKQIDFCVHPNADGSNLRSDVRIAKYAKNASAIELVPEGEGNLCTR